VGFLDKIKKGMELKQNSPSNASIQKTLEKIPQLEKKLIANPENSHLLIDLYRCYVDVNDTTKKIECLEKISQLRPNDSYPLQQLADIYYTELNDMKQAKYYQNMANKITKFF
jgi:tetratricopeptide (TPR) repeat protein